MPLHENCHRARCLGCQPWSHELPLPESFLRAMVDTLPLLSLLLTRPQLTPGMTRATHASATCQR